MAPVILAICPNPCWDITVTVEKLIPGKDLRAQETFTRAGGKGVNVARIIEQLGGSAISLFPLTGKDTNFVEDVALSGCAVEAIQSERSTRKSLTIVTATETTTLNEPGEAISRNDIDKLLKRIAELVSKVDAISMSGSVPKGWDESVTANIAKFALDAHVPMLLDTHSQNLENVLSQEISLLKINAAEASQATGIEISSPEDAAVAAKELQRQGAKEVLITLGSLGALLRSQSHSFLAGVPELQGNPTGAGDSVAAVMAMALASKTPTSLSLAKAMAAGAATVESPVAGALNPETLEQLIDLVTVKEFV